MTNNFVKGEGNRITEFDKDYLEEIVVVSDVYEIVGTESCDRCMTKSVDLSQTKIKIIESHAFNYSSNLISVKFPPSLLIIETNAFFRSGLESIYLTPNVEFIIGSSFNMCPNLNTYEVDRENKHYYSENNFIFTINKTVLVKAPMLFDPLKIPLRDTVDKLGEAFMTQATIKSFFGWKGIKQISQMTFHGSDTLNLVDISMTKITSLPTGSFRYCPNLKTIKLPETLLSIEKNAFIFLNYPSSIFIPHSVISIANSAFTNVTRLNSIIYLGNVSFASSNLFTNCFNMTEAHVTSLYPSTTFANFDVKYDAYDIIYRAAPVTTCNSIITFYFNYNLMYFVFIVL